MDKNAGPEETQAVNANTVSDSRFAWKKVLPVLADNLRGRQDLLADYKTVRSAVEEYDSDAKPSKFAFFGLIGHKQKCHDKEEKYKAIFKKLKECGLLAEVPKEDAMNMSGVPSQYRPDYFVVREKEDVKKENIASLDKLFANALTLADAKTQEEQKNAKGNFNASLEACVEIRSIGLGSLTSVLFMMRPDYFVPADRNTLAFWKKYIRDKYIRDDKFKKAISAENYLEYCDKVKDWIDKNKDDEKAAFQMRAIAELSEKAWELGCALEVEELVRQTKRVVLTGAPGTGKTYLANQIAEKIVGENSNGHIFKCQFHPTYDYSDFVEGLRPIPPQKEGEQPSFVLRAGEFMRFCAKAADASSGEKFVFIIDEINRGDISKIFGETFSALDVDYNTSGDGVATRFANLHSQGNAAWDEEDELAFKIFATKFFVPKNVYVIGTMNDIDRSVESMDFAIRRRFVWKNIDPDSRLTMLREEIDSGDCEYDSEKAIKVMRSLNAVIKEKDSAKGVGLGEAYQIGGAYFRRLLQFGGTTSDGFASLWQYCIEPLLQEYFRGREESELTACMKKCKDAYANAAGIKL